MNYFLYKLIPPRPTFAADMTGTEQAVMAEHAAYWTRQRDLGFAVGFRPGRRPGRQLGRRDRGSRIRAAGPQLRAHDPAVRAGMTAQIYPMPNAVVRPHSPTDRNRV